MTFYANALIRGIARLFTLPRLSLPLILTLGLTLAAVLTVVAITSRLLIKPLPDINESDLYQIDLRIKFSETISAPFLTDLQPIASVKAHWGDQLEWANISATNTTIKVANNTIDTTLFNATISTPEVLGLSLLSGKSSNIDNASEGVWISKQLWQSAFASATNFDGITIQLDNIDYPIFGVYDNYTSIQSEALSSFKLKQVWRFQDLPTSFATQESLTLVNEPLTFVRGEVNALPTEDQLLQWFTDYVNKTFTSDRLRNNLLSKEVTSEVISYRDGFIGDSEELVMILIIAMFSLLFMACLNLMNMFIAHYQTRNKEFAIQMCMGASRGKLLLLVFIENFPLFLLASLFGLIASGWLIEVLPVLAGNNLPLLDQVSIDASTVIIALVFMLSINGIFTSVALLYIDRTSLINNLNSSGKGTPGQQKQTASKLLMIIQLSLACILLTTAGVSMNDSYNKTYSDLGYTMPNAYEVRLQIEDDAWGASLRDYETYLGSEWQQLRQAFVARLSNLGGDVYNVNKLPLTQSNAIMFLKNPDTGDSVPTRLRMWAEGVFEAFDISLLAGRNLKQDDIGLPNIIISKSAAIERLSETEWASMVGQEIKLGEDENEIYTVVGVVQDTVPQPGRDVEGAEIYFSTPPSFILGQLSAVVIMPSGKKLINSQVANVLKGLDSRLGEVNVESMKERWESMTKATRLNMLVIGILAILTLMLAVIGVSGLSQMTASQKRYELAVRMAIGAKQFTLLQLLMKDSLWVLIIGLSLGVIAGIGAYEYVVDLFESAPSIDWTAVVTINVVLSVTMLISIAIPGWKVIRNDPMRTLRAL